MRIVIDTNVVVSAIFFGGKPLQLLKLLLESKIETVATPKIVAEYYETTNYLLEKYKGRNLNFQLKNFTMSCHSYGCGVAAAVNVPQSGS